MPVCVCVQVTARAEGQVSLLLKRNGCISSAAKTVCTNSSQENTDSEAILESTRVPGNVPSLDLKVDPPIGTVYPISRARVAPLIGGNVTRIIVFLKFVDYTVRTICKINLKGVINKGGNYRGSNRMKSEQIRMVLIQNPDPEPLPSPNRDPNLNHFHPI